jgi:hypothetical protein
MPSLDIAALETASAAFGAGGYPIGSGKDGHQLPPFVALRYGKADSGKKGHSGEEWPYENSTPATTSVWTSIS